MGVVSNGMLCSGDELGLTADADGILILPADTPIGPPLADLYGDVVLDVDVKPNRGDALSIVGLAREVVGDDRRAGPLPGDRASARQRRADRRPPRGRGPRARAVPAVRGPLVGGVPVGPSPDRVQLRLLAAGHAPRQQRRRREQLRDARARQADPHVRRGGRPRAAGSSSAGRGRASGSRRSTTSTASSTPRRSLIADPAGPLGIAGVMGGATSRGRATRRRDVVVESADLRSGQHPPDRPSLRAPLRGEPALREGPGVPARAHRRRPRGPAHRRVGRRRGRAGSRRHRPRRARPAARRRSGRRASTACSGRTSRPRPSASLLARVGVATEPAPAGTARSPWPRGGRPLDVPADGAEALVAIVPTWRARPRHRGRHRRGGRPGPRLRDDRADPAGHPDAAVPARPDLDCGPVRAALAASCTGCGGRCSASSC